MTNSLYLMLKPLPKIPIYEYIISQTFNKSNLPWFKQVYFLHSSIIELQKHIYQIYFTYQQIFILPIHFWDLFSAREHTRLVHFFLLCVL